MFLGSFFDEVGVMPVVRTGIILWNLSELTLLKLGVNLIKLLQVKFTSVAIVLESQNNSYTCEFHLKKFY